MPTSIPARAQATDELVRLVGETYGVPVPTPPADLGGYNLNLRVGDLVVRVMKPWVLPGRLDALQRLRSRLADEGLPVALPAPTAEGTSWWPYGDRLVEASRWVPHDSAMDSPGRVETGIEVLEALHAALRRVPGDHRLATAPMPALLDDSAMYRSRARLRERLGPAPGLSAVEELLAALDPEPLPTQLGHGDFGHGNLLFDHGQVVAVLDFDLVALRSRVGDLAVAVGSIEQAGPLTDLTTSPTWPTATTWLQSIG